MPRHSLPAFFLSLAFVFPVYAQNAAERSPRLVHLDIQLYLPSGEKPTTPLAVHVRTDDWSVNRLLYTTSSGWAALDLAETSFVHLLVPAEEGAFAATSLSFLPSPGTLAVHLKPFPGAQAVVSVASLHKPDPEARKLFEKAAKNLSRSRYEEGEAQLREAAALDPLYLAPVLRLGRLQLSRHRFEEAEALFRGALQVDAHSADALTGLGIALSARGDYRAALDPLQEAARLSSAPEVRFHLGVGLMENGRFQEAESTLLPVAESDGPLAATSHFALGRLYQHRGDSQRGISSFESFLLLRPNGPTADAARESIRALRMLAEKPD